MCSVSKHGKESVRGFGDRAEGQTSLGSIKIEERKFGSIENEMETESDCCVLVKECMLEFQGFFFPFEKGGGFETPNE